jgi:hypothetical protein
MLFRAHCKPVLHAILLAGCSLVALAVSGRFVGAVAEDRGPQIAEDRDGDDGDRGRDRRFFDRKSLVISTSKYDRTQGAVASLTAGTTQLPDTATKTIAAVSDGNYVTVWNNAGVDGSFGVTSPIELFDVDPFDGRVRHRRAVPSDEVVTSFSSKSELGLHFVRDW